jgi:hypothetical protein
MSYEPSHRKPPRQARWPDATPGEGWPAYQQDGADRTWESAEAFADSRNGYGAASNGYGAASNGYGAAGDRYGDPWGGRGPADGDYGEACGGARYSDPGPGYWTGGNGYGGTTTAYPAVGAGYADGFDGAADGYGRGYEAAADPYGAAESYYEAPNGWDGYTEPGHDLTGPAGYMAQDDYPALDPGASSVLVAPDTMGEWWRDADRGATSDQEQDQGPGPVVGAVTGLLAAAVAIGVATLAAAFVRPQASPVGAVGGVLVDRLPATLRNHLMAHFGAHAQALLLLGTIGLIAVVLGGMARRNASIGVAGLAAFGLLGAFVAITRPESRASDVIPSVIGALAGIVALLWLVQASRPVESAGPAYGSGRRRTR